MRVPLSWLADLLPGLTAPPEQIAAAMVRAGLEVEQVERHGDEIRGVVVGCVVDVEELTGHKKPIRFCHVDVGDRVHEVVCGATNFAAGDRVPFALPGAELPGGFRIATRQTYGRTSDGMICSEAELGLSDSSAGILVLPPDSELGADVVALLGLSDVVFDFAVTPDRGYLLSVRGVARELATAFGLPFDDPGLSPAPPAQGGHGVRLEDQRCDRYVAATVTGLDPSAPTPAWLRRRLSLAGMRPISLAVDVTNHVMLELGQPLHAFDLATVQGDLLVRRAGAGERLLTLDGQDRELDGDDLVIADSSGPVALAGVMGGAATEISPTTTSILIESAHFEASSITRTARRHRLPSEASKRFERGVDPGLAATAAHRAVRMLAELGGAVAGAVTDEDKRVATSPLALPVDRPGRVAGRTIAPDVVRRRLSEVGCQVGGEGQDVALVTPPSWRPDLTGQAELVEEVIRLEGYDTVPVELPHAPAGRGLTEQQRLARRASAALASLGLVEVVTPPFVGESVLHALGLGSLDAPRVLNPLSEKESLLRPSLLPGLLVAVQRNVGRGLRDVAVFETGSVFRGHGTPVAEVPKTSQRPSDEQLAELDRALPAQPRLAGLALAGQRGGRSVEVVHGVELLLGLAASLGVTLRVGRTEQLPFHPGRAGCLLLDGAPIGAVGELHPRVTQELGLPERTVAGELDLGRLIDVAAARGRVPAPLISSYPPSTVDVALVVDRAVLAGDVAATLTEAAGELLEDLRLFDVYTGPPVPDHSMSLAFSLRFRGPDRTLTDAEVLAARDRAVAAAAAAHGAVLRS